MQESVGSTPSFYLGLYVPVVSLIIRPLLI